MTSESCVPHMKYVMADHHNETISLQVTHKTFVSHNIQSCLVSSGTLRQEHIHIHTPEVEVHPGYAYVIVIPLLVFIIIVTNESVYVHFLALCCCKYVTDRVFLLLHLGVQKHRTN